MISTFQQHLAQDPIVSRYDDLPWLLSGITLATKMVEARIRKAGLLDALGAVDTRNVQGEVQQKLDVYANEALLHCLGVRSCVRALISEENEKAITFERDSVRGKYIIVFDPLDGSSNIDVNVNIGTIFSVYDAGDATDDDAYSAILSENSSQLAAGYVLYGPSTVLVYSAGNGVHTFTLDPSVGAYVASSQGLNMPSSGKYYSCNEANLDSFPEYYREFISSLRKKPNGVEYSSRYIGSLVADFHRTLLKGGIFLYPPTSSHPNGKLRLLYEARPLAFIAEQAGGVATDGNQRIASLKANNIHQRTPLVVGSVRELEAFARFREADTAVLL
jgi:fructose-1,6-bisphosphatase I